MACWCLQILQQEYYFHKIIIKMLNVIFFVFISEVYWELLSKVTFWLFFCIENHSCWLVNFTLYYPFLFQHQLQMPGAHEWWLSSSWSQALNITTSSNSSNYVDSCDFCFLKEIFCHFFSWADRFQTNSTFTKYSFINMWQKLLFIRKNCLLKNVPHTCRPTWRSHME